MGRHFLSVYFFSIPFLLKQRIHTLLVTFSSFFQPLEACALHSEYCSALALGQVVY